MKITNQQKTEQRKRKVGKKTKTKAKESKI